jgi:hypothetical protein
MQMKLAVNFEQQTSAETGTHGEFLMWAGRKQDMGREKGPFSLFNMTYDAVCNPWHSIS